MKAIPEKRLRDLLAAKNAEEFKLEMSVIETLLETCLEEIDTLTVSKLLAMSEQPEIPANKMSAYVLLYSINMSVPRICRFDLHNGFDNDARKNGIGWLYLPNYKPEKE